MTYEGLDAWCGLAYSGRCRHREAILIAQQSLGEGVDTRKEMDNTYSPRLQDERRAVRTKTCLCRTEYGGSWYMRGTGEAQKMIKKRES